MSRRSVAVAWVLTLAALAWAYRRGWIIVAALSQALQIVIHVARDLGAPIDDAVKIPDPEALELIYDVLIHEGLSVGTSSGINIAAAVRVAKSLGPGHTVVTILADGGSRYQSKLFNVEFLRSKGLPVPAWMT